MRIYRVWESLLITICSVWRSIQSTRAPAPTVSGSHGAKTSDVSRNHQVVTQIPACHWSNDDEASFWLVNARHVTRVIPGGEYCWWPRCDCGTGNINWSLHNARIVEHGLSYSVSSILWSRSWHPLSNDYKSVKRSNYNPVIEQWVVPLTFIWP